MRNRIKVAEQNTEFGLFEMWRHSIKGDSVPDIVTLDGKRLCRTRVTLEEVINDYIDC